MQNSVVIHQKKKKKKHKKQQQQKNPNTWQCKNNLMKICTAMALMQLDRPSTNNILWKSAETIISFHQPLNISRNNFNAVFDGQRGFLVCWSYWKNAAINFESENVYYTYPMQKYDPYVNGCQNDSDSLFLLYKWPNFWCSFSYKKCPLKWSTK